MAGRQRRELFPIPEVTVGDQDRTNMLLGKSCEGRFEIAIGSGIHNNELPAQCASRRLQVCDNGWGRRKGRVRENAEHGGIGYQGACVARCYSYDPPPFHGGLEQSHRNLRMRVHRDRGHDSP